MALLYALWEFLAEKADGITNGLASVIPPNG